MPPPACPAPAEQVSGEHAGAESAPAKGVIVLVAMRLDRQWITRAGQHGIVVHGRTLRDLHDSARRALALQLGTCAPPPVQVRPQSPELDKLAQARRRYRAALRAAVQSLREDKASWSDTAQACEVRIASAQDILNDPAE
jgi:hypothetical protein